MWGSSGGGIRERKVAKAAVAKPMKPRILEVKEVKDSEVESAAILDAGLGSEIEGEAGAS